MGSDVDLVLVMVEKVGNAVVLSRLRRTKEPLCGFDI